jgi:hypothetical protein
MNRCLPQKVFVGLAGRRCVIRIAPSSVRHANGTKWQSTGDLRGRIRARNLPRPMRAALLGFATFAEPFVIPAHKFRRKLPVTSTRKYRKISDFVAKRDRSHDTVWFAQLEADLNRNGYALHKDIRMSSRAEIADFLDYYATDVVGSLIRDGFSSSYTGYESTAVIDSDGALVKTGSGEHRFYIAMTLGLPEFPLKIVGMHETYFDGLREPGRAVSLRRVLSALRDVEAAHAMLPERRI